MIKKSVIMMFTTGIVMIIGLISQYFLAHYLTVDQYGQFALMISWIGLLSFFSLNSFNTVVTKAAAQGYPRFFKTASIICLLVSLLGSIILIIIGFYFQPSQKGLFILLAIFFPFYGGINLADSFFIGSREFTKYSWYMIISQGIITASQAFSVYFFHDVDYLLFSTLLFTSLVNIVMTLGIVYKIRQEYDKIKEKELIRYGFDYSLIQLIGTVSSRIQYILLGTLAGPTTLAIYAVAQMFPERLKTLFKSSLNPLSMHLAANNKEESVRLLRKTVPFFFLLGLVVTIVLILLLPTVVYIVFGQKYNDSIIYSVLLLLPTLLIPLNAMFASILVYHGYKKAFTYITISSNILQLLLFVLLIPSFQIWGIIITTFAINLLVTLFDIIWFYRLPQPKNKEIFLFPPGETHPLEKNQRRVSAQINEKSIFSVLESDYLLSEKKYPLWVRILARLSGTKYQSI